MKKALVSVACVAVALIIAAQFATIFVIQLIGAIPEGRTILISRLMKLNFIDSPDALCERGMGSVNLLCRGMVAGCVAS